MRATSSRGNRHGSHSAALAVHPVKEALTSAALALDTAVARKREVRSCQVHRTHQSPPQPLIHDMVPPQ